MRRPLLRRPNQIRRRQKVYRIGHVSPNLRSEGWVLCAIVAALSRVHAGRSEAIKAGIPGAAALNDEAHRAEAVEIIRSLIDKIVFHLQDEEAHSTMAIDLHSHLAGILSIAAQTKKPLSKSRLEGGDLAESTKLVAGARNHLYRTSGRL
jgi:hypothetical protein